MTEVMEYSCSLKVMDTGGKPLFDGDGSISMDSEFLVLHTSGQDEYRTRYRDLDELIDEDYALLMVTTGNRFIISMLGKFYNGVVEEIRKRRRDDTIDGLLLDDFNEIDEFTAKYAHMDSGNGVIVQGKCDLLVFDRAVLVWPVEAANDFIKVFFSEISSATSSDIALRLELGCEEVLVFSMMGKRLPAALKAITEQREQHLTKLHHAVSTAFPDLTGEKVSALVELLKEGLALPLDMLAKIDQSVVRTIENGISEDVELRDSYDFLVERGIEGQVYAGIQVEKFGLDDQEPTFWFLIAQPEGATAMEVTSHGGHATYFFRSNGNEEELLRGARELGRALVDIRFRRTPILLTDAELLKQENARYCFAARRLPYLREVRGRFVGRVVHRSPDGWRKTVEELLNWCENHPEGGRMPTR